MNSKEKKGKVTKNATKKASVKEIAGTKIDVVKKNSVKKGNGSKKKNPTVRKIETQKIVVEEKKNPAVKKGKDKVEASVEEKKVKEEVKVIDKKDDNVDSCVTNRLDIIVCVIVGVIFVPIFVGAIFSVVFVPAALIMFALELFCICYHYVDNPKKKGLVYVLFTIGVILVIGAILFTVIKTK